MLLMRLLVLVRYDWHCFLSVRWALLRRMRASGTAAPKEEAGQVQPTEEAGQVEPKEETGQVEPKAAAFTAACARREPSGGVEQGAEADQAIGTARRCFEERVALDPAEWASSAVLFGQWLLAAARPDEALAALRSVPRDDAGGPGAPPPPLDRERSFLMALCLQRTRPEAPCGLQLLEATAATGHKRARQRWRAALRSNS